MLEIVPVDEPVGLEDYSQYARLSRLVDELEAEAAILGDELAGRRVWMINSTARGGGVAEMLPKMVTLLRQLGVDTEWAVIGSDRPEFFDLTKKLHNLIHGVGEAQVSEEERELFEAVNHDNARELAEHLRPDDLLVVHDPQPAALGALLRAEIGLPTIWRCHIGLDRQLSTTRAAWRFLKPYLTGYDRSLFSAAEYIPSYLAGRASVLHPALDPLSNKNRELDAHRLVGVLVNSGLAQETAPVLTPPFVRPALRLQPDGTWAPPAGDGELGLLFRPVVVQISRWDRLKGFVPLLHAFERLKTSVGDGDGLHPHQKKRLEIVRLVLAGPDPASVADDPEGREVLEELTRTYLALPSAVQEDVALLTLPMESRKENALMVNALQRCASVVVQNSLEEGFGLTVSEALWKRRPVLASRACGIRQQIRDGLEGRLVENPEDHEEIASALGDLLADPRERYVMARNGERRVQECFLVFQQVSSWLRVLADTAREHRERR